MRNLAERLADVLTGDPQVVVTDTGDGYERVTIRWRDGAAAKLDVYPDYVDWKHAARGKRRGVLADLHGTAELFKQGGVTRFVCDPLDKAAERQLLKHGGWEWVGDRLEWVL